jgi:hypothetical protein
MLCARARRVEIRKRATDLGQRQSSAESADHESVPASRLSRNERPSTSSPDVFVHGNRPPDLTSAHAASRQGLLQATGRDEHNVQGEGRTGMTSSTNIVRTSIVVIGACECDRACAV